MPAKASTILAENMLTRSAYTVGRKPSHLDRGAQALTPGPWGASPHTWTVGRKPSHLDRPHPRCLGLPPFGTPQVEHPQGLGDAGHLDHFEIAQFRP
ncbi:hypothetical protein SAMN05443377_10945 [Propionibacterium cyclohexanicum]|uniref:Uncharacterized protein n=1 Tax=Propionibacterium cyclohexanicum TaxID=64702 RepID=A0A1H9RU36_9ACTN|nr:hypothetical protein SAMN05443377_10945 [Propionibacterium cyclohexanicum]